MFSNCFEELDLEKNLIGDMAAREIMEALEHRKETGQMYILRNVWNNYIYTPANKVWGVYSDPYVRPFVGSFVRPSLPISNPLLLQDR